MADSRNSKYLVDLIPRTDVRNDMGRSKPQKNEKTRRSWSLREEEVLLVSLKELVAQGWKSDNGFRAGFMQKLEEAMRREFPNTDLKVNPHILSRITAWKKNYYSLQAILSRSGVGFNLNGDHMIDCDNDQWEQIVKVDANAKFMRNKPWPYWEDWKVIFGKDRATGSNAEDVMEAVNDLCARESVANVPVSAGYTVSREDGFANDATHDQYTSAPAEDSVCQGETNDQQTKGKVKKRKAAAGFEGIFELLSKMHEDNNERLKNLTSRIGYEVDLSKARKEVFDLLGRIPGLSLDDKFDVCEILVKEAERLDLFMGLPDDARPAYVLRVMREKRKN